MKTLFDKLNPSAKLFEELKLQKPHWWQLMLKDEELYIEIRKENYINVYYYGGSLVKLTYKDDFVAETHQKYLGDHTPCGKAKSGSDRFKNVHLDLTTLDGETIEEIKQRIKSEYLDKTGKAKEKKTPAEKYIQGQLILNNSNYIDSEFQYNSDSEIGQLRIDLVELSGGLLSFVELKRITDPRLRNDEKRNAAVPEIIEQMQKYADFVEKYKNELNNYYTTLLTIKRELGLTKLNPSEIIINIRPKLFIANTYGKPTKGQEDRIAAIKNLLNDNGVDYELVPMPINN